MVMMLMPGNSCKATCCWPFLPCRFSIACWVSACFIGHNRLTIQQPVSGMEDATWPGNALQRKSSASLSPFLIDLAECIKNIWCMLHRTPLHVQIQGPFTFPFPWRHIDVDVQALTEEQHLLTLYILDKSTLLLTFSIAQCFTLRRSSEDGDHLWRLCKMPLFSLEKQGSSIDLHWSIRENKISQHFVVPFLKIVFK